VASVTEETRKLMATEPPNEHVRNALQLIHGLRTYEMSSADAVRHEATLNAIEARLGFAVRQLERRA
jgi:hypothetical protein